jgi:hypothetical protein
MEKEVNIDEVLRSTQTRDMLEKMKNLLKEQGGTLAEDGEEILEQVREIEEAYGRKVDDYRDPQERLRASEEFFTDPKLSAEIAELYRRAQNLGKDQEGSPEKKKEPLLTVTTSGHGMPCIEVVNPSPELREIIRRAITANRIDDPAYQLHTKAGAFLQGDAEDWILVEFWQKDYQPFVDYLNGLLAAKK